MAEDLLLLIAPAGTDEASHGVERYRVGSDGRLFVPREAARWLVRNAGFVLAPIENGGPTIAQAERTPASAEDTSTPVSARRVK